MAGKVDGRVSQSRNIRNIGEVKQEFKMKEGEGQFKFNSLAITNNGLLVAGCSSTKRVSIFELSGVEVRHFPVNIPGMCLGGINTIPTDSDDKWSIVVCGFTCQQVKTFTPYGDPIENLIKTEIKGPNGIVLNGEYIFLSESPANRISVFNMEGELQYRFGSGGQDKGQFKWPHQLCVGPDDYLYVSDMDNHRVQVLEKDGTFVRSFGEGILKKPVGIAVTMDGYVAVVSYKGNKVSFFTVNGRCVHEIKDAGLEAPCGITVDKDGFIYVADSNNLRIVKF